MYEEPNKRIIRSTVLHNAVEQLTTKRCESTIATSQVFDRLKEFMTHEAYHPDDRKLISYLKKDTEDSFKTHLRSFVGEKNPSELRVAYLAGPNPENDVKILVSLQILPENIWAFEMDRGIYHEAIENLYYSYPQLKIMQGKIGEFFEVSPIQFDIVYLDFCGPLFPGRSDNRNVETIFNLFYYNRLMPIGCVITNFAYIDESNDKDSFNLLKKFIALYLYPKCNIDHGAYLQEEGLYFDEWLEKVYKEPEYFYSEFIRRFMMDLSSVIVPTVRLIENKKYMKVFFNLDEEKAAKCHRNLTSANEEAWNKADLLDAADERTYDNSDESFNTSLDDDLGGRIGEVMDRHSIPWFLHGALSKEAGYWINDGYEEERAQEFNKSFYDEKLSRCLKNFCEQIHLGKKQNLDYFMAVLYLTDGEHCGTECLSKEMQTIVNTDWYRIAPQACDVFTELSVIPLLIGQVTVPSHINVLKSQGYSYKARETKMFTDVWTLDTCRYLYDMLPTIDMLVNRIEDISSQVCYRMVLDSLDKNFLDYLPELFFGNAMADRSAKGLEARHFPQRLDIDGIQNMEVSPIKNNAPQNPL